MQKNDELNLLAGTVQGEHKKSRALSLSLTSKT